MRGALGAALLLLCPAAGATELGREVFNSIAEPRCALCHTLAAAGAAGKLGPSLDELKPDKARALQAIRDGVGVMPAYADKLTRAQIEALAAYVARSTR